MNFRTEHTPAPASFTMDHTDEVMLLGSCFAENIGAIMQRYRFPVEINPHGILFNPESIAIALEDIREKKVYGEQDLISAGNRQVSLQHHGSFCLDTTASTLSAINSSIAAAHERLTRASVLMITLGSAWVWHHVEKNCVVANCHKIPQQQFRKVLIDHAQITARLEHVFARIRELNPEIQIVITVSPVRYLRDGLEQNNLSKSHLLIAAHQLASKLPGVSYFPAYELVIDDLRDYRFYGTDMLHPSADALLYVWEKCGIL